MNTRILVLLSGLAAVGCGAKSAEDDPNNGGRTRWLSACDEDAECGSLQCLAKLCTRPCDNASDCSDLNPTAECRQNPSEEDAVCVRDSEPGCMDEHPLVTEADARGDQVFSGCGAPPPGTPNPEPVACDASTIAGTERECELENMPCANAIAVSRAAALCIAMENFDLTTLEGPYLELGFHSTFATPTWNVITVTAADGATRGGAIYTIDATDGEVLGSFGWFAVP